MFSNRSVNVDAGSGLALTGSSQGATSITLGMLTGSGNVGGAISSVSMSVGGGNLSSTFGGSIGGGTVAGYTLNQSLKLVKTGTGVFTLAGNNTYTGTTTVSQGTLALSGNGSIGNTPLVLVSPGAVLNVSALNSGAFALGSNQTLQAGRTSGFANDVIGNLASSGTLNVAGSGTAGTLTIGGNLALNGGTMLFDFANVTTAGAHVNDLITLGGSLSLGGTTTIVPNLLNSVLTSGTYTLISGGASLAGGNASDLAWGGPLLRQSVAFDTTTTPGTVYMTLTGSSAKLLWSGASGSVWDTDNTSNWNNTGMADKFYALDNVTFSDAATGGAVTLSGTLQPVSVTVDNGSVPYTFAGSGQIAGTASLVKSGTGTLTLATANSYTGSTTVNNGTLRVTNSNALADSTNVSVTSSATLDATTLGSLNVSGSQTLANQGTVSGNIIVNGTLTGTGVVTGSVNAGAGATVAPGDTGVMTIQNGFTLGLGAHLAMEIGGTTAGFGTDGTDGYDQLMVSGNRVTLAGDLQFSFINPTFSLKTVAGEGDLSNADRFVLIVNDTDSPVDGAFSNPTFTDPNFSDYPDDAMTVDGQEFLVLYNTDQAGNIGQGHDVTAFAVPEPSEWTMLIVCFGILGGLRQVDRRKRSVRHG